MALTPEQLAEMDAALGASQGNEALFAQMDEVLAGKAEPKNGMFERLVQDVSNRAIKSGEIRQATRMGEQSKAEEMLQLAGQAGGLVGDVSGELLGSALGLAGKAVPQGVKDLAAKTAIGIAESPVGQLTGDVVGSVADKYSEIPSRARRNIEAVGNLAMTVPPLVSAGDDIIKAGASVGKSLARSNISKLSSDDIRALGSRAFKESEALGGVLKPQFVDDFISEISKKAPQTQAGTVLAGENPVTQLVSRAQSLRGKPLTLDAAKEVDEILGDLAFSDMDSFGKLGKQGQKFNEMQRTFRNMIERADASKIVNPQGFEKLKEARNYWSASLKLRDVERIINNAENMQVPATSIKAGFRNLLRNGDKLKGYSPKEIKAIESAAKTGVLTDILNVFGSRLGPLAGGVVGAAGGPIGSMAGAAGTYAISTGARKGAEAIQKGKAEKVADLIRSRVAPNAPKKSTVGALGELAGATAKAGIPIGAMDLSQEELIKKINSLPPREAMELLKQMGVK